MSQEYTVNVNADRSGTITVKITMNNSTYEQIGLFFGDCMAPKSILKYIGDRYFPGFTQTSPPNQTISGVKYVYLVYTRTSTNLDTLTNISVTVVGNELRFQDERFITLIDHMKNDPCLLVDATNVSVQYQLTLPYAITINNADTKAGNVAYWTFTLGEKQNINARCNLPATTTPTTTVATTTATTCPDTDGDGWNDCQEAAAGTNPNNKDTDGDGVWDPHDPNPLVAETTAVTTTVTTTTVTTPQRTPAPALPVALAALCAAAVLLLGQRRR